MSRRAAVTIPVPIAATAALLAAAAASVAADPETPAAERVGDPSSSQPPAVWIFNGTPGDEEHHAFYEALLDRLVGALTSRFALPRESITVLYGPVSAGYDGICNRENLGRELARAREAAQAGTPVWLIFQGHANPTGSGARFNLHGPDLDARQIGEALGTGGNDDALPVRILFTTSSSGRFLRHLAGPGRLVITATSPDEPDNETEFPTALADALESTGTDRNGDGAVSMLELFLACRERVVAIYEAEDLIIKEKAVLDGDGDGLGTQRPARRDAEPAEQARLPLDLERVRREGFD